jgi:hypothetical protein
MMEISPPELGDRALTMIPEAVHRQDGEPPAPDATTALDGRLRLGGPVSALVSKAYVANDVELRTFVEREAARYRYHLVHLAITATLEPGQTRIERVLVQLRLSAPAADAPIAWSMTPIRVDNAAQLSTTWRIGPQLKLFDASVERTESRPATGRYLEAQNELRSDPAWEVHRTRGREITGVHRLALVVRAPVGAAARVDGAVHATIAHGRRPWRESADLPGLLELSAEI